MLDTVYLHLTKACNLRCVYCYFNAGMTTARELSFDEMSPVLKDVNLLNPNRVVFTGGEPLLRKDVFKLAHTLRNNENKVRLFLTTNGTLITDENAKTVVECFDEIRISIDGLKEINDALRGVGTFEASIRSFKHILKAGGDPVAFITVTNMNYPYLKDFMCFLLKNGIFKIHLSPLKPRGRAKNDHILYSFEQIQKTVTDFWYEHFGLHLTTEKKVEFNCGVGKFLTVYPDGSVYPCHMLSFPEFYLGNVKKQRLYFLYHHSNLLNKLRALHFGEIEQCVECSNELAQESGCLGDIIHKKNIKGQFQKLFKKIDVGK